MNDRLKEAASRIPFSLIFFVLSLYFAWDWYTFTNSDTSPIVIKRAEIETVKQEVARMKDKLKAAEEFYRQLDQKRKEIQDLSQRLDEKKVVISEDLNIAEFIKMVVIEAKRVGITVISIRPIDQRTRDYYIEQPFELAFVGVYGQLLLFLERLSNVERVVRVDRYNIERGGAALSPYVELKGVVEVKTFQFTGVVAPEDKKEAPK